MGPLSCRVAIIGGGAVGLAYASFIGRVAPVLVIDRNPGTSAAHRDGRLRVLLRDGETTVALPSAFDVVQPGTDFHADWVLVSTKAFSSDDVARQLAQHWKTDDGLVVSVQNGVGNRERLAHSLGVERVRAGICHISAKRLEPGVVEVGRAGLTRIERRGDDPKLVAFAGLMEEAGLETQLDADIDRLIWNKLIIAVGCNAIAALCRIPLGAFSAIAGTELGRLVGEATAECAGVMEAKGIPLDGDPVRRLEELALSSPGNHPSMLQDVLRRQSTEVDFINGAVVREAEALGVDAPLNRLLASLIKVVETTENQRVTP